MVASGLQLIPLSRVSMCASYWKKTDKVGMWVSWLVREVFSDWRYQMWLFAIAEKAKDAVKNSF